MILAMVHSPAQATNLVQNGSFENIGSATHSFSINNPTILPNWAATPSGNKILDCLVVAGESMSLCGGAFEGTLSFWQHPGPSPDGGNFVAIDGSSSYATPLTQTINGLTIGSNYIVSFYQAAGQQYGYDGDTTERWKVTFGSAIQYSTLMSTPNHGHVGWMSQALTFTATATSQVLSFMAVGTPAGLPPFVFLDGVAVNQVGQVPEPGTMGLIALGLLAFPAARRLRRK
jgi:hypothetical protein